MINVRLTCCAYLWLPEACAELVEADKLAHKQTSGLCVTGTVPLIHLDQLKPMAIWLNKCKQNLEE